MQGYHLHINTYLFKCFFVLYYIWHSKGVSLFDSVYYANLAEAVFERVWFLLFLCYTLVVGDSNSLQYYFVF